MIPLGQFHCGDRSHTQNRDFPWVKSHFPMGKSSSETATISRVAKGVGGGGGVMIPFHAQILTKFTLKAQFKQNFTNHEIQYKSIEVPLSLIKTKEPKRVVTRFGGCAEKTLKLATEIRGMKDFDSFVK